MLKLTYSPEAESDLLETWIYISEDKDPETADRVLFSMLEKFSTLLKLPEMGRRREELSVGLRSIPHGSYIVFYWLDGNQLEIVRVLHGARDVELHFGCL